METKVSINNNIQNQQVPTKKAISFGTFEKFKHETKPDSFEGSNKPQEQEKGLSKAKKILFGLGAVAVATGAIILGKKLTPQKAKEVERTLEDVSREIKTPKHEPKIEPKPDIKIETPKVEPKAGELNPSEPVVIELDPECFTEEELKTIFGPEARIKEPVKTEPIEIKPKAQEIQEVLTTSHRPVSKLITSSELDKRIEALNIDRYKEGLPLRYSHSQMTQDLSKCIYNAPADMRKTLHDDFNIGFIGFNGRWELRDIPNLSAEIKTPEHQKVMDILTRFTRENTVEIADTELKQAIDGFIKDVPEFAFILGKAQHETHNLSVGSHTIKILQKAIKYTEGANLTDEQKEIMKMSILLHDFGKQFKGIHTSDTGHAALSKVYAEKILERFDYTPEQKKRILNLVENHHWFKEYNKGTMPASAVKEMFGEDIEIAKSMARADLESVNDSFHLTILEPGKNLSPRQYNERMGYKLDMITPEKIPAGKYPSKYPDIIIPEHIATQREQGLARRTIQELDKKGGAKVEEYVMNGETVTAFRYPNTKGGSNPGGLMSIGDKLYYAKFPREENIGQCVEEVMASQLYRAAGIDAPNIHYLYDKQGKIIGTASEYIPCLKEANKTSRYDGFAVDAWLNNWDAPVIGNTLQGESGAIRIDVGGSMRYRAQNGQKRPEDFTESVDAISSLIKHNCYVYDEMTTDNIVKSLDHVVNISDDTIRKIIIESPMPDEALAEKMIARKKYLTTFQEALKQQYGCTKPEIAIANAEMIAKKGLNKAEWLKGVDKVINTTPITTLRGTVTPIVSREEYAETLERLAKEIHYVEPGEMRCFIKCSPVESLRKSKPAIPYEMEGASFFAGDQSFYEIINRNLSSRELRNLHYYKEYGLKEPTNQQIDEVVKCVEYSLGKIDEEFGKYEGIVFRAGYFGPEGGQYFSTSLDTSGADKFINWNEKRVNVIKVKNGHKISDMYEKYGKNGYDYNTGCTEWEKEILLSPNSKFRELGIDDVTDPAFKQKIKDMADTLYKHIQNYGKDEEKKLTYDEVLKQVRIWEEV